MISGKLANILPVVLPLFYRKCPMGNAHTWLDIFCDCCTNNEFTYVNGKWVLAKNAKLVHTNCSSVSWSGQLSSGELWWSGIKQGLVLALILGTIIGIGLWKTENALRGAADNRKDIIEQTE